MKKKYFLIILLILALALPVASVAGGADGKVCFAEGFSSGQGTASSPYLISSPDDMKLLSSLCSGSQSEHYLSAYYKLTKDIDMGGTVTIEDGREIWSGQSFTPIAAFEGVKYNVGGTGFKGVFDGNGKKITNLYINATNNYIGLFGVVDGGTVKNLILESGSVAGKQVVGGIVGALYGSGTISDCVNGASVYASSSYAGGITGYIAGTAQSTALVTRCINKGGVSSDKIVGGIAGANEGRIYECFNIGGISGISVRGAIVGANGVEQNVFYATISRTYYNKDTLVLGGASKLAPTSSYGSSKVQCEDNKLSASKMVTLYGESSPLGMELDSSYWIFNKPSNSSSSIHYYPIPKALSGYKISVEVLPGVFTVQFDLNGATCEVPADQSVREGEYVTRPKDPERAGYEFLHWATSASGDAKAFDFENTKVYDDITLYAIWVFKDPKVSVETKVTNGRTATTAVYGDTVTLTVVVNHGAQGIEYEWYKQGQTGVVISRKSTLTLTKVKDSGVYYCRVRVFDTNNQRYAYSESTEVRIAKAVDPSYSIPEVQAVTYKKGLKLGDIELPSGYSWQKPDTLLNATGSAGKLFAFTFVPEDQDNYQTIGVDKIKVVVNKATYENKTHTPLSGIVYKYGLRLSDIGLDADFSWKDPSTLVFAGQNQVFEAYYNAEPDNYEDFELTVTVSVDKAVPLVELDISNVNLYENTNPDKVIIPLVEGSTPGVCRLKEGQTLKVGALSSYEWKFVPSDADNYTELEGTVELFVQQMILDSIAINKKPLKMSYTAFEELNPEGMEVVRRFNSGDEEVVSESEYFITYIGNPFGERYFLCNNSIGNTNTRSIRITLIDNSDFSCEVNGFTVEKARYDLNEIAHPDIQLVYSESISYRTIEAQLKTNYSLVYKPAVITAGYGQSFTVTYNDDVKNYYDATLTVTVNIDKAEYSDAIKKRADAAHDVIKTTYTAGLTLSGIKLKDNFYWEEENLLVKAGTRTYKAYYNADRVNYNDYELEIKVSVARAVFDLGEYVFEDAEFIYDGQPHSIEIKFASGVIPDGVSIDYDVKDRSRAGSYKVAAIFTLDEPENYEPIDTIYARMTIIKQDVTVDFNADFVKDGGFVAKDEEQEITTYIKGLLDGDEVTVKLKVSDEQGNIIVENDDYVSYVFEPGVYTIIAEIVDDNYKTKEVTSMSFTVKTASVQDKKGELPQVIVKSVNGFDPHAVLNCGNVDISGIAKQLNENLKALGKNYSVRQMLNINLYNDRDPTENITIDGTVEIRIRIPDELLAEEDAGLNVVYVGENNVPVDMKATREGNYLVFDANHLSNYAIVASSGEIPAPDPDPVNPDNPVNPIINAGPFAWIATVIIGVICACAVVVGVVVLRKK